MWSSFAIVLLSSSIALALRGGAVVQRISPKGFRIKTSDYMIDERIVYVIFNINLNRSIDNESPIDFVALTTDSIDGQWFYDNINTHVEVGWQISYRIDIFYNSNIRNASHKPDRYLSHNDVFSHDTIDITQPTKEKCSELYQINDKKCELSATTVRGKAVCKGQRVFDEHFDEHFHNIDPIVWKIDARIPLESDDYPFVSYQNDPEVVYTQNNWLFFKPKFLAETPGFNESLLRTGTLEIPQCTGFGEECVRNARYSQILPPIISAKLRTKHSFSFRYGKIVIGARMPISDWMMPILYLEPLENFYGTSKYASGQIQIASLRGNRHLRTHNGKDISSRYLSGGIVLDDGGSMDDVLLRHYETSQRFADRIHNFTLTWTENNITLGIDGYEYGTISEGFNTLINSEYIKVWRDSDSFMAPFDREFYLTIGLTVGGHREFPDDCKSGLGKDRYTKPWINKCPKAMLNFWKAKEHWMKTWNKEEPAFGVHYILVDAL